MKLVAGLPVIKFVSETEDTVTLKRSDFVELVTLIENMATELASVKAELKQLKRAIYGSKHERFIAMNNPAQLELKFDLPTNEPTQITQTPAEPQIITYIKKEKETSKENRQGHGRNLLSPNLRRVEQIIEPENLPVGSIKIGEEITEILEYKPMELYVNRIIRPKYKLTKATKSEVIERTEIIIAELPTQVIPKGIAGASVIAYILISKFIDHLPYYRIIQIFKRSKFEISESTICGWTAYVCDNLLNVLYEKIKEKMRSGTYLMSDETTIRVQDSDKKGKTHTGYFWTYYNPPESMVYFEYQKTRNKEWPKQFFQNFSGSIQTDGYTGYDEVGTREGITHLACMAHARRKFDQAKDNDKQRAEAALSQFQALYKIEEQARIANFNYDQRKELRQKESSPLLKELETWLETNKKQVFPKSAIYKAINYTQKLWPRLVRYVEDGKYEIDNNLIENKIRPIAIGRKNYLFAGNHQAAERNAMLYTFFANCKINEVNPQEWFEDVLKKLPDAKMSEIENFLPHNWIKLKS